MVYGWQITYLREATNTRETIREKRREYDKNRRCHIRLYNILVGGWV